MKKNSSNSTRFKKTIAKARGGEGNTVTSPPPLVSKKQPTEKYQWVFTWNNYFIVAPEAPEIDIISAKLEACKLLEDSLKEYCKEYIFQCEIGKCGTPHIQGYLNLIKKMRLTAIKKTFGSAIHWETMKGTKEQASKYCVKLDSKDPHVKDPFCFGMDIPTPKAIYVNEIAIKDFYPWQKKVLEMMVLKPDNRTINVVYDPAGCAGKTILCKAALDFNGFTCGGGSAKDIACFVALLSEKHNLNEITTFFFNFARDQEKIPYKSIEAVKDGLVFSPKYESCTIRFNNPHIWLMTNNLLDWSKLTNDRWKIWAINSNKELISYVIETNDETSCSNDDVN